MRKTWVVSFTLALVALGALASGCPGDDGASPPAGATAPVGSGTAPGRSAVTKGLAALPGRTTLMPLPEKHFVLGTKIGPPFAEGLERAVFAMGCYWGAEKQFWNVPGVHATAVGFAAGVTPNPTYHEVCTGKTGHAESVLVVYDPKKVTYEQLLKVFWEGHDPTQGMRQGNDRGTQYRSGVYVFSEAQRKAAEASRDAYQVALTKAGHGKITTEIVDSPEFYYAEEDHQQYLAKNPDGYCGHGGTGVSCPVGLPTK